MAFSGNVWKSKWEFYSILWDFLQCQVYHHHRLNKINFLYFSLGMLLKHMKGFLHCKVYHRQRFNGRPQNAFDSREKSSAKPPRRIVREVQWIITFLFSLSLFNFTFLPFFCFCFHFWGREESNKNWSHKTIFFKWFNLAQTFSIWSIPGMFQNLVSLFQRTVLFRYRPRCKMITVWQDLASIPN